MSALLLRYGVTRPAFPLVFEFDGTENPISESGLWFRAANLFSNMRTGSGRAFGTMTGLGPGGGVYDDSYSYLKDWPFGPNFEIEATMYVDPGIAALNHEFELHAIRGDSASGVQSTEALFNRLGGNQTLDWNGNADTTYYTNIPFDTGGSYGTPFVTGDRIKARFQGTQLTQYVNSGSLNVTTIVFDAARKPGIASYIEAGGNCANFCISRLVLTPL